MADALKIRAHMYVSGRVQGVFFRDETQDAAVRQGVTGWVRNLRDGRVEAVFEGDDDNVERLVEFCRVGPPGAGVRRVDVLHETYTGEFRDFQVRYDY